MTKVKLLKKIVRIPKIAKLKTYLLRGCPQRRGTCLKLMFMAPKKPNSASRKVAKLTIMNIRRSIFCYIPGIKHTLQKFSTVLLRGGRTKDLPGLKYKAIRGVFDLKGVNDRFKARSKYGIKRVSA